jgi:hypothetical protein
MMKLINEAFDVLKSFEGELEQQSDDDYSEALSVALNAIINLDGLEIEICGAWVWVSGNTYAHKAVLKGAGFHYASKKKSWHFRPEDWASRSRGSLDMDGIREKYGSTSPKRKARSAIAS